MSRSPAPAIRVRVDPTNPGHFFACCGLLEIADRLQDDGAEGWFSDKSFLVTGTCSLREVLDALVKNPPEEMTSLENGLQVKPLIAPLRLSLPGDRHLVLDAWMTFGREKGQVVAIANPPWNFWSGQQTSMRIWKALSAALQAQMSSREPFLTEKIFFATIPLSGRFGFDPGAAWEALDVGFSPNEQNIKVSSSPVVEMLAAVGIQRFRPRMSSDREGFEYGTWGRPLPPSVASAAAACAVTVPPSVRFRARVVSRGSYAALGRAVMLRGGRHE